MSNRKGLKKQLESNELYSEKDLKEVAEHILKSVGLEIDSYKDLTKEKVENILYDIYKNPLVVNQYEDNGQMRIMYGISSNNGSFVTGLLGLKNVLDQGVVFSHVIFNGVELDDEQTVEFWTQYKEMIDERLSKN